MNATIQDEGSLSADQKLVVNNITIPFVFLDMICNTIILLVIGTAPTSYKLRKFMNRLVAYLAAAELLWDVGIAIEVLRTTAGISLTESQSGCDFLGVFFPFTKVFYAFCDVFYAVTMHEKIVRNRSTASYERPYMIAAAVYLVSLMILAGALFPIAPVGSFCFISGPNATAGQQALYYGQLYLAVLIVLVSYCLTIVHIVKVWNVVGNNSKVNVHKRAVIQLLLLPCVALVIFIPDFSRKGQVDQFPAQITWNVLATFAGPLNLMIWGISRKIWNAYRGKDVKKPESESSGSKHPVDIEINERLPGNAD